MAMELHSPAFADGARIPDRHSRDGGNVPPPLRWTGVPQGTAELALEVTDPDAPSGSFVHWIVAGLDPALDGWDGAGPCTQGRNGWGQVGYGAGRGRRWAILRTATGSRCTRWRSPVASRPVPVTSSSWTPAGARS
jgi:hypothetical protein